MNLLHIGHITENKSNGINVVVPQHIINQSKIEGVNVALLNISRDEKGLNNIKHFSSDIQGNHFLDKLKAPFNKPDLVVFHGIYYKKYIKIYKVLLKRGIPYIVFPHGSLVKRAMRTKAIKKYVAHILLFNKFIKNAVAVQFLTKGEQDNSIFSNKGIVLPNGLYVSQSNTEKKEKKEHIQIIFIGRKNRMHKGLDLLMEAIILKRQELLDNKLRFVIVGPDRMGTDSYINEVINKFSLEDIVVNMGAVYGEEKENLFKNSDIFVHTSRWEGLPTAVLEAMNNRIPVFVTRGTNMYEDVENNSCGWVAETNVASIVTQLEKIIQEKDLIQEYGENAYNYVKSKYDWDKISKEAIEEYRKIINDIRGKQ